MKIIKIGLSAPNNWKIGAEALKWYMNASYSHAYIRYTDDSMRDIVFQAAHGTVHPILYSNFTKHNTSIHEFDIEFTEEEYQNMRDICYSIMGDKYSYLDLIMIFTHDMLAKIGIFTNKCDIQGYVCSELVAFILHSIKGIHFDKPLNLIRPDDLYNKMISISHN